MEEKSDLEKLTILLSHWVDHNKNHVIDMKKWEQIAEKEAPAMVVEQIRHAIHHMEVTDNALQKALEALGGKKEPHHHHHHDHHHH